MTTNKASPHRLTAILLGVVGVLVLASLVLVFSRGTPPPIDGATPAGAVQRYVTAALDGQKDAAAKYLTPKAQGECDEYAGPIAQGTRVTLLSTIEHAQAATVMVSVSVADARDPFGGLNGYSGDEAFELSRVDGVWLISFVPWQLHACTLQEYTP